MVARSVEKGHQLRFSAVHTWRKLYRNVAPGVLTISVKRKIRSCACDNIKCRPLDLLRLRPALYTACKIVSASLVYYNQLAACALVRQYTLGKNDYLFEINQEYARSLTISHAL